MKALACTLSGGMVFFSPLINRILRLTIPFLMGTGLILLLYSIYDYNTFLQIFGLILVYFIPPAGKESIIPAAIAMGIPLITICISISFIDIISCLFMLWNFDVLVLLPFVGQYIPRLMRRGSQTLAKHTWLERVCFIGLIFFVFIPLQGTGSVSGTILGKMAGMPPLEIFLAISIGATLHSFFIGLSAYALNKYLGLNLWYLVVFILGVILLITIISFIWYRSTDIGNSGECGSGIEENQP
ncbi:MAG: small multi-drug export protein [Methanobacteriota archaeon]